MDPDKGRRSHRKRAGESKIAVLIVDDDPSVRNVLRAMIEPKGYAFLLAGSGAEALTLSRTYTDEIQLLISDMNMPEMNGVELAKQLSEERPGIRTLLISGYAPEESEAGGVRLAFLKKPFVPQELWLRLEELLGSRYSRPAST